MPKITQLTKANLRDVEAAIIAAAQPACAKLGLTIRFDSGSFNATSASLRLLITVGTTEEDHQAREALEYAAASKATGGWYPAHWYGREIELNGQTFTVVGVKARARKNDIRIRSAQGKEYITSRATVERQLGHTTSSAKQGNRTRPAPGASGLLKQTKAQFTEIGSRYEVDGNWHGQQFALDGDTYQVVALDEDTDGYDWILCVNMHQGTVRRFTWVELNELIYCP